MISRIAYWTGYVLGFILLILVALAVCAWVLSVLSTLIRSLLSV